MKTLYYVSLYNRDANQIARFAVSATDQPAAIQACLDHLGDSWLLARAIRICATPDDVCEEL